LIPAAPSSSPSAHPPTTWLVEASPSHSLFVTPFAFNETDSNLHVPPDAPNLWSNFEFSRFMEESRSELGPRANRQKIHMKMRHHLLCELNPRRLVRLLTITLDWFHRVVEEAENDVPETALDTLSAMRRVWESEKNIEQTRRCITA
jgi:hypothetical protein